LYPKSEVIGKTITEFAKKVKSSGCVVIDDNSLIIGSYYENDETKHLLNASTPYFLTLNDSFQIPESGDAGDQMVVQRFGKYFVFKQVRLKSNAPPYYLLILKEDTPDLLKEDYDSFVKLLQEILYK